jgi:hypothetical protein
MISTHQKEFQNSKIIFLRAFCRTHCRQGKILSPCLIFLLGLGPTWTSLHPGVSLSPHHITSPLALAMVRLNHLKHAMPWHGMASPCHLLTWSILACTTVSTSLPSLSWTRPYHPLVNTTHAHAGNSAPSDAQATPMPRQSAHGEHPGRPERDDAPRPRITSALTLTASRRLTSP